MNNIYLTIDIDGTIYDVSDIVAEAFENGIQNFLDERRGLDLNFPDREEITKVLGLPMEEIFIKLFPDLNKKDLTALQDECTLSLVLMINDGGGIVFENVFPVLKELHEKGFILLVASNGRYEYVQAILQTHDLMQFFTYPMVFPGDEDITDKSGVVAYYKEHFEDDASFIMIGDRYTDRQAASDNNIPFIGCAFGHAGTEEIRDSKWIVHGFAEIPKVVDEIVADMKDPGVRGKI